MIVSVRRQRPRMVLAVLMVTVLGLVFYGPVGGSGGGGIDGGGLGHLRSGRSAMQQHRLGRHGLGGSQMGSRLFDGLVGGGGSGHIDVEGAPFFQHVLPPPKGGIPPNKAMLRFWKQLHRALLDARPRAEQTVVLDEPVTEHDVRPDPALDRDRPRVDKVGHRMDEELRGALKAAHAAFVQAAYRLGPQLPYAGKTGTEDDGVRRQRQQRQQRQQQQQQQPVAKATKEKTKETAEAPTEQPLETASTRTEKATPSRGIVMTAGGKYVGIAVTSILMLRRNGSRLPVQLFLDSDADYDARLCETVLPALGAECHVMQRFWEATPELGAKPLERYQLKVFSILLSSFQEVLFFDADCWPIHSPDGLFDAEPFASHGLVTWPDFWLSTAAPAVYDIMGVAAPSLAERRSSEAGVLLYDKARQGASLLMAAYYNFYGPSFYYPLLSQGAEGQGDKETFLHGALALGSPFYAVHTHIDILGRRLNGTYMGAAMRQADPVEDYRLEKVRRAGTTRDDADVEDAHGDANAVRPARWLFVHHNLIKIDLRHLGPLMRGLYARDAAGAVSRLWGVERSFNEAAGYDVERAMWDEVWQAACGHSLLSTPECDDLQRWYRAVF